jgi:hypothetical protein
MGYRLSASGTLLNHLAACQYQTAAIIEMAIQDPSSTVRRPGAQASRNQSRSLYRAVTLPNLNITSFSHLPYNEGTSNPGSPMVLSPLIMATGSLAGNSESWPTSPAITFHPDNSISAIHSSDQGPVASGSNLLFQHISEPTLMAVPTPVIRPITPLAGGSLIWTTDRQAAFESRLAQLTACAGLRYFDTYKWFVQLWVVFLAIAMDLRLDYGVSLYKDNFCTETPMIDDR